MGSSLSHRSRGAGAPRNAQQRAWVALASTIGISAVTVTLIMTAPVLGPWAVWAALATSAVAIVVFVLAVRSLYRADGAR